MEALSGAKGRARHLSEDGTMEGASADLRIEKGELWEGSKQSNDRRHRSKHQTNAEHRPGYALS